MHDSVPYAFTNVGILHGSSKLKTMCILAIHVWVTATMDNGNWHHRITHPPSWKGNTGKL